MEQSVCTAHSYDSYFSVELSLTDTCVTPRSETTELEALM